MMNKDEKYRRQLDYMNVYNKKTYRTYTLRFNKNSENEIIDWLNSQDSLKTYITTLILSDMKKKRKKG